MTEEPIGESNELALKALQADLHDIDIADRHTMSNNALIKALKEAQDKRDANEG